MIRKINFTGRKRITKDRASVTLTNTDKHPLSFDIQIDFAEIDLPQDANVFVEAYKRTSYMRFPFGKVGDIKIPAKRDLEDFELGVMPLFRVKVVDNTQRQGRIIALADKILPKGANQGSQNKTTLLQVEYIEDLGNQIWRLDLEGDWPTLQLNRQVDAINDTARSDPAFLSLVYPDVVRQILNDIIDEDNFDPELDKEDWPSLWITFVSHLPGVGSPPSGKGDSIKADLNDWVEKAVAAFCDSRNFLADYNKLHSGAID